MKNLFHGTAENPFHISVGAVVIHAEEKILAHHYIKSKAPEHARDYFEDALDEIYILMRESLENNETLEGAVLRGAREEFGVAGEIERYIGSLQSTFPARIGKVPIQKTTLYFQVRVLEQGERIMDDEESFSDLVWMSPQELISKMEYQGKVLRRSDIDESAILKTYLKHAT